MPGDFSAVRAQFDAIPPSMHESLRTALNEGHLPTILMVLVQFTGDASLLERCAPYIRAPYLGGITIPDDLATELRARLFDVLTGSAPTAAPLMEADLVKRMMSACVGEPVTDEFLPLLADQMGFVTRTWPRREIPHGFKVLVIGTGLAGLCNAIMLDRGGYNYDIVEKYHDIGGAWLVNTYPGVGVDTPSHFYSYSFEPNPEWNHYFPKGNDMFAYLSRVTDKYGLRAKTQFNTEVTSLVWDEASKRWNVTMRKGDGSEVTRAYNAVACANGLVDRPAIPAFARNSPFKGPIVHTARWDRSLQLDGKKVVVIGTGASSAQLCPSIARRVSHLTIVQRSRHWLIPVPGYEYPVSDGIKWALRHIPFYAQWFRFVQYWYAADGLFANVQRDPNWDSDTSASALNEQTRQWALGYMHEKLGDRPDLIEKITPDVPIFSKRIVMDAGWYDMLKRDNVDLVQLGVDRLTEDSVVFSDGSEAKADVILLATGFEIQRMLSPIHIVGREGKVLREWWKDEDAEAYMGVMIPGFPNFLVTPGPNSAPNHAGGQNIISEVQAQFLVDYLNLMLDHNAQSVDVRREAHDAYNDRLQSDLQNMIWTHRKARSYYRNSKGRVTVSWPRRLVDYWTMMRQPDVSALIFD